jgi:hypothetical protein
MRHAPPGAWIQKRYCGAAHPAAVAVKTTRTPVFCGEAGDAAIVAAVHRAKCDASAPHSSAAPPP